MILPKDFEIRMQDMLKEAYPAFLHSYENEKYSGLRVNLLKGTKEAFLSKMSELNLNLGRVPWNCIPWEPNGFYYENSQTTSAARNGQGGAQLEKSVFRPGRHPMHEAGVYYIQEPSAMAPAVYLEAEPGEKILDLCAAPGGKTTQIASYMQNEGILVCNEIHGARAKILSENVERMGISNALVTNETPQRLAEIFDAYFDGILVDAPCSGEGMFRKNEEAVKEWSLENVQLCADRQDEILDCADLMLRPGGRLVYSTCTFAPAENEGSIARFLERHPDYEIVETDLYDGMAAGVPEWVSYEMDTRADRRDWSALKRTIRLFPHLVEGEGHYLAVLHKAGEVSKGYRGFLANGEQKGIKAKEVKEFFQFQEETLCIDITEGRENCLLKCGEQLYLMPRNMPSIKQLKVLRQGLHLGAMKKNRFEPSHALALALKTEEVKYSMELCTANQTSAHSFYDDDMLARAYLSGQTLSFEGEKGWYLITYKGYSIGWGKLTGQVMKNHYPKGLRKT